MHAIRYKFSAGDLLIQDQEMTLLVTEPDGKQLGGQTHIEMIQQIMRDHGESWDALLKLRTLKTSGILGDTVPKELAERSVQLRMDSRGTLLDLGNATTPPSVPAFPMEAVGQGQSWIAVAPSPEGTPVEVQYHLEKFEETADDLLAHMVTLSRFEGGADYVSETQGSIQFSLKHGHQKSSTTVVKLTFDDGRVTQSVVELKLRERRNA